MGITGLLPLLEKGKVSRPANLNEFKGCTVAADAYCWLHKGAFACADKLARGEPTDMYVFLRDIYLCFVSGIHIQMC